MFSLHIPAFFPKTSEIIYLIICSRLFIGIGIIYFFSLLTILFSPIPTLLHIDSSFFLWVQFWLFLLFLSIDFYQNNQQNTWGFLGDFFLASWVITQRLVKS